MCVGIDKTRCDDEPLRVDLPLTAALDLADGNDAVADDREVTAGCRGS